MAGTGVSDTFETAPFHGREGDPLGTRMDGTMGLAVADDGTVLIADAPTVGDQRASRVWALAADWSRIEVLAGPDGRLGELTGASPHIASDGKVLSVLDTRAGVLIRIDLAAETVEEAPLQGLPDGLILTRPVAAPDGGLFAVGGPEESSVWHVDPQGRVRELRTSEQLGGGSAGPLATDGQRLYVETLGLTVLRTQDLLSDAGS